MTETAHTIIGGAIARAIPDPILAPVLALCSHFIIDSIPHWDFGTNWRSRSKAATGAFAIGETLFGLGIGWVLFKETVSPGILLPTLIASVLPDIMEAPWYIFFASHQKLKPDKNAGFLEKLTYTIYKTENHFHTKAHLPWGIITQVLTVLFFLMLLSPA